MKKRRDIPLENPHLEGAPFLFDGGEDGILLIHGFTATPAEIRPMAEVLNREGWTAAGPALPGHGISPDHINRFSWQDWYAEVEKSYLVLSRRCSRVVVGGESLGSLLALYLASQHPEAAGVLCYAPALKLRSPLIGAAARVLAPFVPYLAKSRRLPTASSPRWQGFQVYPLKALTELLRLQSSVWKVLPEVRQPLLVIQGRLDLSVNPGALAVFMDRVGSQVKELHWMERSSHCVVLDEECEKVEELTLNFLKRLPGISHH
jgi:carboxylesterase